MEVSQQWWKWGMRETALARKVKAEVAGIFVSCLRGSGSGSANLETRTRMAEP